MNLHGLSDSVGGVIESPAKCRQCGATTRLGNGLCLSCTLREGLEDDRESSRESFDAILAEDEVQDTHWRVGNYEILEEIGRGGMGVIYRARQRHSRRIVALKRMVSYQADSRETLERFRREAEAAASLDHPNILPIYEVGQGEDGLPFFTMRYAAGGSLQKAGPALRGEPRECVRLMAKVAHAVQYAHEHGILHRDLKPGNILLDGHGEPFVTDFGLAKWLDASTDLTRTLTIFGTPGYIAPEQAKGPAAKLTPAADVYSLGALLFDLFTGRPPFLGEHALAVIQQASEKPAPKLRSLAPALDRDLETICARCLEREPRGRYQSAGALAEDLEHWFRHEPIRARRIGVFTRGLKWARRNPTTTVLVGSLVAFAAAVGVMFWERESPRPLPTGIASVPYKSIAVLPFGNLSADPENAFFTDGMQDEILNDLAKIADLKVISRTSMMQYKSGVKRNLRQIANELGVAHVVEGSVQRSGDRVRVNAQLIDARNDTHLWAQTYDRELTDIFAVESDIASTIANTLQAKLTGSERKAITSKPTENPEAYQLYLRGRFFWNKRTAADLRKAIDLFEEAVAKDPHYAQAYAAIAQSWALLPAYEDSPPKDCFPKAQTAAEKALALDQSLSDAHTALAAVKVLYNFDAPGSIAEFEQAIKLNPNDATAHHWLGNHPLTAIGDLDRALAEVRRAQELDPLSLIINTNVGWGLLIKGRYDEAVAQLRKTIEMDGTFYYARYILGQTLQLSGHIAEAEKEYKKAIELATDPVPLAYLAHLCGTNGRQEEARKILNQLLETRKQYYIDAYCLAIAYLGLGDRVEAMNWLEQGYRDRNGDELVSLRVDPFLKALHGDPRFEALAEKIVPVREFKRRVAPE